MKPKEILKRSYTAIIAGAFFPILELILVSIFFSHIETTFIVSIIALAFVWLLTIHNNKRERYTYISIILLVLLWGFGKCAFDVWIRGLQYLYMSPYFWNSLWKAVFYASGAIIMVAGFRSETKYYNIFKNQPKAVSIIFRVLNWLMSLVVWAFVVFLIYIIAIDATIL